MLELLEKSNFDPNFLPTNRPIALNLKNINTNFRMNERVFDQKLSKTSDQTLFRDDINPRDDCFSRKMFKTDYNHTVVHKLEPTGSNL